MAKVKGPLFSLGASQQLGKTLVYFAWKGLNVVRSYVIPANPKTTLQTTQRGYLSNAIAAIHGAQEIVVEGFDAEDISAVSLWANTERTPRTWFNQLVKNMIEMQVALKTHAMMRAGSVDMTVASECSFQAICGSAAMINATLYWGTSTTALFNKEACNVEAGYFKATFTGLTKGVKYFMQLRADAGDDCEGLKSGIYTGKAT